MARAGARRRPRPGRDDRPAARQAQTTSSPTCDRSSRRSRDAARRRARHSSAALRSARYVDLLDRLVEAAAKPGLTPAADAPAGAVLPPLVRSVVAEARARRRGALDADSPDQDYHRVRVLAKRARYAAEAVAPGARKASAASRRSGSHSGPQTCRTCSASSRTPSSPARRSTKSPRAHPEAGAFNLAAGRLLERQLHGRAGDRARDSPPRGAASTGKKRVALDVSRSLRSRQPAAWCGASRRTTTAPRSRSRSSTARATTTGASRRESSPRASRARGRASARCTRRPATGSSRAARSARSGT